MTHKLDQIDACLPQTQCGECGYTGCKPYARAILENEESIDRCPPGGIDTLNALATMMQIDPAPFHKHGRQQTRPPESARIIEAECIGCTKCIQVCPVDAIAGSSKRMHTVINTECTGCGPCVPVCPVDCIVLDKLDAPRFDKNRARARFENRNARLTQLKVQSRQSHLNAKHAIKTPDADKQQQKLNYIQQAIARNKIKYSES